MTGPGTTTYMLGEGEVVVIDPGPAIASHLEAILASLAPHERIGAILVTHPHRDHSALVSDLVARCGAPVYGYGVVGSGRSKRMRELVDLGFVQGGEGADLSFSPDHILRGGEVLHLAGLEIEVIHTPGHMGEHLAFALGDQLFCGDHVMEWAPSLVSPPDGDMTDYLDTLRLLSARQWKIFYPSHGAAIEDPASRIEELLLHRIKREQQILSLLGQGPQTIESLTQHIYAGLMPGLRAAGSRNIVAHLIDLLARQQIRATEWPSEVAKFSLNRLK